jgi:hypothetical protein
VYRFRSSESGYNRIPCLRPDNAAELRDIPRVLQLAQQSKRSSEKSNRLCDSVAGHLLEQKAVFVLVQQLLAPPMEGLMKVD